jgi:hypothetical protein
MKAVAIVSHPRATDACSVSLIERHKGSEGDTPLSTLREFASLPGGAGAGGSITFSVKVISAASHAPSKAGSYLYSRAGVFNAYPIQADVRSGQAQLPENPARFLQGALRS